MSNQDEQTVHASCVLVGRAAVLIRGPSGSGKSRLARELIEAGRNGTLPPAWLVTDDRVRLFAAGGRLIAAAPAAIAGKIEVRGAGIRDVEHEPLALVRLVVDLAATDAARMPDCAARRIELSGVKLSRLPIVAGEAALPLVVAAISAVTEA